MFSEEKLKKVVGSILSISPDSINDQSTKDNVKNWDSLKHMNLILALEEEFEVTIPDEEAADLTSYPLIRLVMKDLVAAKSES